MTVDHIHILTTIMIINNLHRILSNDTQEYIGYQNSIGTVVVVITCFSIYYLNVSYSENSATAQI